MKKLCLAVVIMFFSCGVAEALPQDWPCEGIEVTKTGVVNETNAGFEYSYFGETENYSLNINLMGSHQHPFVFADCGTAGCGGTITDKTTQKTEEIRFFCEEYSKDYTKVKCVAGFSDEVVFKKADGDRYVAQYCANKLNQTLRFNLSDCQKCHCLIHWYDGDMATNKNLVQMACLKEQESIRCFTPNGYEAWRDFQNEPEDYENCVDMSL